MLKNTNVEITKAQIEELLNEALNQLYNNDSYLVDNSPFLYTEKNGNHHVGERSIVFRLAYYMQNIMNQKSAYENYVLDCEYNRNGEHAKKLPSFPRGVYPDIIIHDRGNNDNNVLIMEVKTYWNSNNKHDLMKICEFVDGNGQYHFLYGVSLIIKKHRKDVEIQILS